MSERHLHPDHLADLRRSGLSDETIKLMDVYSPRPADIPKLIGWNPAQVESALVFPYFGANGFCRIKVFPPYQDGNGHTVKYLQRKGSAPRLYVLSPFEADPADLTKPLFIVEGEKKTAKAI